MFAGRKIFHKGFARVSPVFAALGVVFLVGFSTGAAEGSGTASTSLKRQAASAQFARGEDQRAALNAKPANKRTLAEYKQVVSTYRRVYLITPHAPEVPDALLAVAELYTEMGDRFGRSYYQSAVDSYRFLIRDYPASRHGQDALLRIAQIEKDQLDDAAAAAKAYDEFLKKYPRSPHRREAQEARAELALLQNGGATVAPKSANSANATSPAPAAAPPAATSARAETPATVREGREDSAPSPAAAPSDGAARVRRISTSASAESTRVTIDLEDAVEYSSARIRNPDRIFVDLHAAKITPDLAKSGIRVEGDLLTAVRVGQFHAGIVRVVLDVTGVKEYTASLEGNPPKLVIDLYPDSGAPRPAKVKAGQPSESAEPARSEAAAAEGAGATRINFSGR